MEDDAKGELHLLPKQLMAKTTHFKDWAVTSVLDSSVSEIHTAFRGLMAELQLEERLPVHRLMAAAEASAHAAQSPAGRAIFRRVMSAGKMVPQHDIGGSHAIGESKQSTHGSSTGTGSDGAGVGTGAGAGAGAGAEGPTHKLHADAEARRRQALKDAAEQERRSHEAAVVAEKTGVALTWQ